MSTSEDHVGEVRRDQYGPIRCMAEAEDYVMVRRKRCIPSVMHLREWLSLDLSLAHEAFVDPNQL